MTKVTWWLGWTGWLEWLGWHGWLYHYNNYSISFKLKICSVIGQLIGLCSKWLYCPTCLKLQKFFAFSVEPSVSQLSPWWQAFITYVCYVLCIDQNNWLASFCSFCRAQRSDLGPWSQFDLTVDGINCRFFLPIWTWPVMQLCYKHGIISSSALEKLLKVMTVAE